MRNNIVVLLMALSLMAFASVSQAAGCGDGIRDKAAGEQCDNGSNNSDTEPDACRSNCIRASCGDGVADSNEQCDGDDRKHMICSDFNSPGFGKYSGGTLGCDNDCRFDYSGCNYCGDGVVNGNEQCDDGNNIDDDGCNANCTSCLMLDQVGNIELQDDIELCSQTFELDDYGDYGAIIIKKTGVTLDCDGAVLKGTGRGIGILNFRSNDVTIKDCTVVGYDVGIKIDDASNTTLQHNRLCGNSVSDIELVNASNNHGQGNRCNKAGGWQDDGNAACMSKMIPCTPLSSVAQSTTQQQGVGGQYSSQPLQPLPGVTPQKQGPSRSYQSVPGALQPSAATPRKPVAPIAPRTLPRDAKGVEQQARQTERAPQAKGDDNSLYSQAKSAAWRSGSGNVAFGSDRAEPVGMAYTLASGSLADGKRQRQLLVMRPDAKRGGYIMGTLPLQTLGQGQHFSATIGMLQGAPAKAGASFELLVREGKQVTSAGTKKVRGKGQTTLKADLSRWGGKRVQLILKVQPLQGSPAAPAVWVNPQLK